MHPCECIAAHGARHTPCPPHIPNSLLQDQQCCEIQGVIEKGPCSSERPSSPPLHVTFEVNNTPVRKLTVIHADTPTKEWQRQHCNCLRRCQHNTQDCYMPVFRLQEHQLPTASMLSTFRPSTERYSFISRSSGFWQAILEDATLKPRTIYQKPCILHHQLLLLEEAGKESNVPSIPI